MGRIKEELIDLGYNARERTYVYAGTIVGALAPIVGARFLMPSADNWMQEVLYWGGAVFLQASTMLVEPHFPIPSYTGAAGALAGTMAASHSRNKRFEKERSLERIASEATK